MPPEVFHSHSHYSSHSKDSITAKTLTQVAIETNNASRILSRGGGKMKFTKRKLIPVLLFFLLSASILRLLQITMITSSSSPVPSTALPTIHQHNCSAMSICRNDISNNSSSLTDKETRFLLDFFSRRIPSNLLIFGHERQYLNVASLNSGGVTVFLHENIQQNRRTIISTNNTRVYRIAYNTIASEAYEMLKVARENPDCKPEFNMAEMSKCNLGLLNLPHEVYDTMWDVVVVDGPSGDRPDSPGRMAAIYTASILARRGNTTHVIVHDVDRIIEKWFSREFLCEENLVSSKGRFWHISKY